MTVRTLFGGLCPFIALLLCISFVLAGCSDYTEKEEGTLRVVTSFYPVYVFTRNLTRGVDEITVTNLTEQNAGCLHDYKLLTRDVKLLSDCDLLVLCGAGSEEFLGDLTQRMPELATVDSSVGVTRLYAPDAHSSHLTQANSHIWMSVKNAVVQVNNICDALKRLCPGRERELEENRLEYIKTLEELYEELVLAAGELSDARIITFHEAYDYMAQELSLNIAASIESEEGGEPTARELGELSELIKAQGINALFVEPYYSGSAADILSRETSAEVFVLNPMTSGDESLTAYEDTMRNNIAVLTAAVCGDSYAR